MSKKFKRILASIALVFALLFTASLIAFFYDRTLFHGAIGMCAMFCGGITLALFFVIKLSRDYSEDEPDAPAGKSDTDNKSDKPSTDTDNTADTTETNDVSTEPDVTEPDDPDVTDKPAGKTRRKKGKG